MLAVWPDDDDDEEEDMYVCMYLCIVLTKKKKNETVFIELTTINVGSMYISNMFENEWKNISHNLRLINYFKDKLTDDVNYTQVLTLQLLLEISFFNQEC